MKAPLRTTHWTLAAGLAVSIASALLGHRLASSPEAPSRPIFPGSPAERETPIVRVVREVGPTVVNLYTELEYTRESFYGRPMMDKAGSLGAGVIVHPSGLVVTNAHVITANLDSIRRASVTVSYRPGWTEAGTSTVEQYAAELLGFNPQNDLALLRIKADRQFPVARLGTSSDLMIGETVVAVGNPYGREGSVTHGIISAVNRDLETPAGGEFRDLIQTDASLNAGNSGGPLFNILGELIGINQAIGADQRLGRAEGQGLAIPVDRVRRLIEQQFTPFELGRGYLGMEVATAGDGVEVQSLDPDGPASAAGLRAGDRIRRLGEFPIASEADFHLSVLSQPEGEALRLQVDRDGRGLPISFTPASIRDTVEERLGARLEISASLGPVVERVYAEGPADALGILKNDILLELGGSPVRTLQDLFRQVQGVPAGEELPVQIRRYRKLSRGWGSPQDLQGEIRLR